MPETAPAPMSLIPPQFTFAFQPVVNVATGEIVSFEALVRGPQGEPAWHVLQQVGPIDAQQLDEQLRVEAIRLASVLGGACRLNLNLMPRGREVSPTAIATTLDMARQCGLAPESITLEITESEILSDFTEFADAVSAHRDSGMHLALDDFGAGYAGLNLLAEFRPDAVKLDMQLVRGIEAHGARQAIVRGIQRTCADLGIDVIAKGVETDAEYSWFRREGFDLFQGFLFARPALRHLPMAFYPPEP
ncbi:MAG: hypothetical protein RL456_3141 [Pseudomonadota bacterium]|jgi:EAL domain-containing protein (putative c-di-GMP-specific phosphodiesterase class I)